MRDHTPHEWVDHYTQRANQAQRDADKHNAAAATEPDAIRAEYLRREAATHAKTAADSIAERVAETDREFDQQYREARELEDEAETKLDRLRECLALRNNPGFARVRDEARDIVERIREIRDTLRTDYANVL